MTPPNRPWFWIESLIRRRASTLPALASDARSAAGRPARTTVGLAPADTSGIRSRKRTRLGHPVRIDELREETDERDRTVKYSKGAYEKADRE